MRVLLVFLLLTCSLVWAGPFEDRQKAGDQALARKDYPAAIKEFERLVKDYPTSPEAHNALGYAYFLSGRYERAIYKFREALQLSPSNPAATNNLILAAGKLALEKAADLEYSEALSLLREMESQFAGHPQALALAYARGQLEFYRSNDPEGLKAFRQIAEKAPTSGTAQFIKAYDLERAGKLAEAAKAYEAALKKKPDEAIFRNYYALCLVGLGKPDVAVTQLERALEDPPPYLDLRINLARLYERLGKFDDALVQLKSARQLRPDFASVHLLLAALYRTMGDSAAATREFGLAMSVDKRPAVLVNSETPGTSIWLDGVYEGVTPTGAFLDKGKHVIKSQSAGKPPVTRELELPDGKVAMADAGTIIEVKLVDADSLKPGPNDPQPAPSFQLKDRYNHLWRSFQQFHRRPVVLLFWKADSPNPEAALEALGGLANRHPNEVGVAALHCNSDLNKAAQKLLLTRPSDYAELWDEGGKIMTRYGLKLEDLPALVVIDLDGYIAFTGKGLDAFAPAEAMVVKLLQASGGSTTPAPPPAPSP